MQLTEHLTVQSVHGIGPVQRNGCQAILFFEKNRFKFHRLLSLSNAPEQGLSLCRLHGKTKKNQVRCHLKERTANDCRYPGSGTSTVHVLYQSGLTRLTD
jgi:hypothetical protein